MRFDVLEESAKATSTFNAATCLNEDIRRETHLHKLAACTTVRHRV